MGACQSQVVDRQVANGKCHGGPSSDIHGKSNNVRPAGTETPGNKLGGKGVSKIPAYELALMTSPSERTNVTQAMTPTSQSAATPDWKFNLEDGDFDDISELDVPFDEGEEGDDDNEVPSDEEGYEGNDDDEEWRLSCARSLSSVPDDLNEADIISPTQSSAPGSSNHELVTPRRAVKKRLGFFTRSAKKKRDVAVATPGHDEEASVEAESETLETLVSPAPETRKSTNCTTPLVAPPKGVDVEFDATANPTQQLSVNPQTLASFNKMKIQAQQAESLEQKKRQHEKIKDRRKDIQGYNDLWDEYSAIQEKVSQAHTEMDTEPTHALPISIQDTSSWFVDFESLNDDGYSQSSQEGRNEEDDDAKSCSSFSLHSEMNERAQRDLFKEKARKRRMSSLAQRALASDNDTDGGSSLTQHRTSVTFHDNHSTVSDFSSDNGSVSALERNDDYGVLRKFRHKSIEQSVMGYSDYFEETPQQQTAMAIESALKAIHYVDPSVREEVQGYQEVYPDAPTPKTVNSRAASIESYLEEMSLPSVSIENAETGVVRWREFPKSEERAKTARKLEFQMDDSQSGTNDVDDTEKEDDAKLVDNSPPIPKSEPGLVLDEKKKPKIKTYHPVIASMSTEDFYRASASITPMFRVETLDRVVSLNRGLTTKSSKVADRATSSIVADGVDPMGNKKELKSNRDLLARKVGTKLAGLVAQLKENGLGERAVS